jgi:hypothetical protein
LSDDAKRITMSGREDIQQRDEQIVAAVDKDAFRAMFYLFAGKPDSKHQAFREKVTVSPADIVELNEAINEKFRHHSISQVITTISLSLDKNKSLDFGTWAEFVSEGWRQPENVRDLTIKWDFLIKLDAYAQPQRHTLTVNFTGAINPAAMLRVVVDAVEAPQELDMSKMFGGCMARVDFISHSLADELLAIVGRWHAALSKPITSGSLLEKCERNDMLIARVVQHSIPAAAAVVSYYSLWHVAERHVLASVMTVGATRDFFLWLLGVIVGLWVAVAIGKKLAQRTYRSITSYGAHHPFAFTRGDQKHAAELAMRNKRSAGRFLWTLTYAIGINVIAGLLVLGLVANTKNG